MASWILRLSPLTPDRRAEVEGDLDELYAARRRERGAWHAYQRLGRDLASLWLDRGTRIPAPPPRSTLALLHDARADLGYSLKLFMRQPGVLLLTIAGLSIGLGIATAAFSIMNAAVLRGDGVVDPDRAPGVLRTTSRSVSTTWAYDEFLHLRGGSTRMQVEAVLTETAAVHTAAADAAGASAPVAFVSGGFFAATGGRTIAGRPLDAADERQGGPPPVVVSFAFWTARLNRDPQAVGRPIRVGTTDGTIVGVAQQGFSAPHNRLLWMPLTSYGATFQGGGIPVARAPESGLEVFGRLPSGTTAAEAEAQLDGVAASLPAATSDSPPGVTLDARAGLGRSARSEALATSVFVFAVIALVLLLAGANTATVLIATAMTRDREMGVRAALGASRWRLVRQLVTESLALGTTAAAIGLLFAQWTIPLIGRLIEAPPETDLTPDLGVYVFLGVVTLLTGVGAGLAPAWHGRTADLVTPLKGEGARPDRVAPRRLRSMLVVAQAAISVLLLVLAALFMRATISAASIDVGLDAAGLYTVSPGPGGALGDDAAALRTFLTRAPGELRAVPGITAVTLVELPPFGDATRSSVGGQGAGTVTYFNRTQSDYFDALGLRIVSGRTFAADEVAANAPVAVISRSLARAYWHDRSPLGELLPQDLPIPPSIVATADGPALTAAARPTVIGVVDDAVTARLHERSTFAVYQPLDAGSERFAQLMFRVEPRRIGVVQQAMQRLRAIAPHADVRITSVEARLQQEATRPRSLAAIMGVVGLVAITLCVIGLYGLTASVVGQRTREMGVRIAVGAEPADLLRLLMWDCLRPVAIGLALGAGGGLLASRAIVAAMFFGVSAQDPIAYSGAAAVLLVAAVLAVLIPTRRAATVDAAVVLRRV